MDKTYLLAINIAPQGCAWPSMRIGAHTAIHLLATQGVCNDAVKIVVRRAKNCYATRKKLLCDEQKIETRRAKN